MSRYQLVHLEPQATVARRARVRTGHVGGAIGRMLEGVFESIETRGTEAAGPPYARYYDMGETMDVEVGVPVAAPLEVPPPDVAAELPGGRAVTTQHVGPYDALGDSWIALYAWIAEEGLTPDASWERYLTDPDDEPDPARWITELVVTVHT
jgi:effector-binding domain-containing protein